MTVIDEVGTDPAAVADWLAAHLPEPWVQAVREGDWDVVEALRADPAVAGPVLRAVAEAGLATPGWPREHGGLGLAPDAATAVLEQVQAYRAHWPMTDFISLALAGPTILAHGTEEQKQRFLAPTARGELRWCQLFSEPGAGSDLAGLSTRAERQDDGTWLVNGQKVWSSFAHLADFGILMARTDPELPKHRGITYFLLDMRTPGVETRPLRQMTGDAEFNEVFLTDVVVPDEARLGAVNDGWAVGISTLMQERSGLSGRPGVGPGRSDDLLARARQTGAWESEALQDRLLDLVVRERVLQMTTLRAFAEAGTADPGAEGSIRKLANAVLLEDLACLAMDVEPFGGASWPAGGPVPQATQDFLSMKELSIAGGTSEIQRNIIAERLLGLPKDVDPDKGLPFAQRGRS